MAPISTADLDIYPTTVTKDIVTTVETSQFPPGTPIASLPTIHLAGLAAGDESESAKLFDACKMHGFFYLDLRHPESQTLRNGADTIFTLSKELFDLGTDEKMKYDVDKLSPMKANGYKPLGRNLGGLAGKRDGFETYSLPKDGIMDVCDPTSFSHPQVIDRYMPDLKTFTTAIHAAAGVIFASLSNSLGLPPGQDFSSHHRVHKSSPDIIRMLKYHPQPPTEYGAPHIPHTDIGSLTFLFSDQPGLQFFPPGASEWQYVRPRPGHAIINLGDGMSLFTNGLFHSCLHRVNRLPNRAMQTRYSFAYMVRAENDTVMKGLGGSVIPEKEDGPVLTSSEWLKVKFGMLRLDTFEENKKWVLTGVEAKN